MVRMAGMAGVMIAASSSASTLEFPILTSLVLVPLLGAAAVLFFGRMRAEWGRGVGQTRCAHIERGDRCIEFVGVAGV
ncbi:MAG: hypothetical protein RIR87_277 [Actinomycetota bacterium]